MLDTKVAELLNTQVNKEFYSAYLYLDFANYYTEQGLEGFANWYNVQAQEERDHAMLMIKYLQNNGCKVTLEAIDRPDQKLDSFDAPLRAGYAHEQYVTGLIHTIYDLSLIHISLKNTKPKHMDRKAMDIDSQSVFLMFPFTSID